MKLKKIIMVIGLAIILAGCNKSASTLDMKKASTSLDEKYQNMALMSDKELEGIYNQDTTLMEEYIIKSSENQNGNFYALIKVKPENKDKVKNNMDEMFSILENQSSLYSPEAVNLIKNKLATSVGDYLIYIVSENNEEMYNVVKEYIN